MSKHAENSAKARAIYIASLSAEAAATDWEAAKQLARTEISNAMSASYDFKDFVTALKANGSHTRVLRQLLAPPCSQDQFSLICPSWSKASEKNGTSVPSEVAADVARIFALGRDRSITPWLDEGRLPSTGERLRLAESIGPMLAMQQVGTTRRTRMADVQERAVTELLDNLGWNRTTPGLVSELTTLKPRDYARKTRFATATLPQEVDIACGLQGTRVLAMECKVTNDATNSIKRINDVLKKASAWKHHWGSFVETAALLQGVIKAADVDRLESAGVHVFWSHDLPSFKEWLLKQI